MFISFIWHSKTLETAHWLWIWPELLEDRKFIIMYRNIASSIMQLTIRQTSSANCKTRTRRHLSLHPLIFKGGSNWILTWNKVYSTGEPAAAMIHPPVVPHIYFNAISPPLFHLLKIKEDGGIDGGVLRNGAGWLKRGHESCIKRWRGSRLILLRV